jgi:hypothetical protein
MEPRSKQLTRLLPTLEPRTYSVSLSAKLHGRSGTFVLTISPRETARTILSSDSSRVIKGLMHFQDDGNIIQFLEREEKKRKIVSAQRKR